MLLGVGNTSSVGKAIMVTGYRALINMHNVQVNLVPLLRNKLETCNKTTYNSNMSTF